MEAVLTFLAAFVLGAGTVLLIFFAIYVTVTDKD